jgi:hypothetical protein
MDAFRYGRNTYVPEGQMTVARRFIAGVRDPMARVPEGRLNSECGRVEFFTSNPAGTPDW